MTRMVGPREGTGEPRHPRAAARGGRLPAGHQNGRRPATSQATGRQTPIRYGLLSGPGAAQNGSAPDD